MKIHVCSMFSLPYANRTIPVWDVARKQGHEVTVSNNKLPTQRPDAVIVMGVAPQAHTLQVIEKFPDVPFFVYNWDVYEWVWTNPRPGEYDYKTYGEVMAKAKEIWVPSECTGRRTTQWYDLKNWRVILSSVPWWDYSDISDGGYALCCLREIPDPAWGMFEKTCQDIGIPFKTPKHELEYENYKKIVANARFLVAPLYEVSTGGLSLYEAYYHGKPCLISDSKWNGAKDYLGERATYFEHGNLDDFKNKLLKMYHDTPVLDVNDCRKWVTENYSEDRMINDMLDRMAQCGVEVAGTNTTKESWQESYK